MRLRRRVKRKSIYALVEFTHYQTIYAVSNLVCGHTHLRPHSSSIALWLCAILLVSASSLTFYVYVYVSVCLPFHLSFFLSFCSLRCILFFFIFSFYFSLSQANSVCFFYLFPTFLLIIIYILE